LALDSPGVATVSPGAAGPRKKVDSASLSDRKMPLGLRSGPPEEVVIPACLPRSLSGLDKS
jgi:hypothetical protein